MTDSSSLREAGHRLYVAALQRAYSEEANGGRETAAASASLDFAHDEWSDALHAYVATYSGSAWTSVYLHGNWRFLTEKMTTEERESAAAAVEHELRSAEREDPSLTCSDDTWRALRWWRY